MHLYIFSISPACYDDVAYLLDGLHAHYLNAMVSMDDHGGYLRVMVHTMLSPDALKQSLQRTWVDAPHPSYRKVY